MMMRSSDTAIACWGFNDMTDFSKLLNPEQCAAATAGEGPLLVLAAAVRKAMLSRRGASRTMCAAEFDAVKIYDDYVKRVAG